MSDLTSEFTDDYFNNLTYEKYFNIISSYHEDNNHEDNNNENKIDNELNISNIVDHDILNNSNSDNIILLNNIDSIAMNHARLISTPNTEDNFDHDESFYVPPLSPIPSDLHIPFDELKLDELKLNEVKEYFDLPKEELRWRLLLAESNYHALADSLSKAELTVYDNQSYIESAKSKINKLTNENRLLKEKLRAYETGAIKRISPTQTSINNIPSIDATDDQSEFLQKIITQLQMELNASFTQNKKLKEENLSIKEFEDIVVDLKLKYAEALSTIDDLAFRNSNLEPQIVKLSRLIREKDNAIEGLKSKTIELLSDRDAMKIVYEESMQTPFKTPMSSMSTYKAKEYNTSTPSELKPTNLFQNGGTDISKKSSGGIWSMFS